MFSCQALMHVNFHVVEEGDDNAMVPDQALRSPLLAAAISHLQHAAATLPWTVRVASVQALSKVRPLALSVAGLTPFG